jgi:hypothetical protein
LFRDDGSELAAVVRAVAHELDANIRQALVPVLKYGRGRVLSDDYDESDARQLGKGAFSVVWMVKHRRTVGAVQVESCIWQQKTFVVKQHTVESSCDPYLESAWFHSTLEPELRYPGFKPLLCQMHLRTATAWARSTRRKW